MTSGTEDIVRTRWSSDRPDDRFDVENPATGKRLAAVQGASWTEVDAAVTAAQAAFESDWRWRPPRERGLLLVRAADVIAAYADELARLESSEMGKPVRQAARDVLFLVNSLRYFGGLASALGGHVDDAGALLSFSMLEPYGVIGGIIPFNWPPIHTGGKAAPALAAGNTVVLKPPEQGPLTIIRIVELLQEVLPADVLHVVPGLGAEAGLALAAHPGIGKMSFTGSTATGRAVLKTLADNLTPALLELGGKNALVVLDDADLEDAVGGAVNGAFYNQGEACTASSRVLVPRHLHDEFLARMVTDVRRLRVGDPADEDTDVGPLVTRQQQERVLSYIEIGIQEGAQVAASAVVPTTGSLAGGFWVAPTVFTGVSTEMRIAREEIFGPVMAVMAYDTEDEAVEIANATEFGLVAGVYSRDTTRALRVARRISAGMVFINNYSRDFLGTPFGGTKGSGYGREHSPETLREFGYSKAYRLPSGFGEIPQWPGAIDTRPSP